MRDVSVREAELVSRLAQKELEIASLRDSLAQITQATTSPRTILPAEIDVRTFPTPTTANASAHESYQLQRARLLAGLQASGMEVDGSQHEDEDDTDDLSLVDHPDVIAANHTARWTAARETLVVIACSLRETLLVQSAFRAWLDLLWRRRLRRQEQRGSTVSGREHTLAILSSLEDHRRRLIRSLHEAHLENRWHRQYLGSTLRHKQILLLWCGRTLRRCWLAWAAHIVRARMQREVRHGCALCSTSPVA